MQTARHRYYLEAGGLGSYLIKIKKKKERKKPKKEKPKKEKKKRKGKEKDL